VPEDNKTLSEQSKPELPKDLPSKFFQWQTSNNDTIPNMEYNYLCKLKELEKNPLDPNIYLYMERIVSGSNPITRLPIWVGKNTYQYSAARQNTSFEIYNRNPTHTLDNVSSPPINSLESGARIDIP